MRGLLRNLGRAWLVAKLAIFVVVSVVITVAVVATLLNRQSAPAQSYRADVANASDIQTNDPVRVAGVEVGRVTGVRITPSGAQLTFTVEKSERLSTTTRAVIGFENLFGQRNLTLSNIGHAPTLAAGAAIPESRTDPGLDLTDLLNGFQPLYQALTPNQINQLTANIIGAFQGEQGNMAGLISQTASLTRNLVDKSKVIDQVVDNLTALLRTANTHSAQVGQLIDSFAQLSTTLADERGDLSNGVAAAGSVATQLDSMIGAVQAPLQQSVSQLDGFTSALAANQARLNGVIANLNPALRPVTATLQTGTYVNGYLCNWELYVPYGLPLSPVVLNRALATVDHQAASILTQMLGPKAEATQLSLTVPDSPAGDPAYRTANCR